MNKKIDIGLKKKLRTNACFYPPSLSHEKNGARVDVGIVFPFVLIGLFLTTMIIISSEFNQGLSSFLNNGIYILASSIITFFIIRGIFHQN